MSNTVEVILSLKDMMSVGMREAAANATHALQTVRQAADAVEQSMRYAGKSTERLSSDIYDLEKRLNSLKKSANIRGYVANATKEANLLNKAISQTKNNVSELIRHTPTPSNNTKKDSEKNIFDFLGEKLKKVSGLAGKSSKLGSVGKIGVQSAIYLAEQLVGGMKAATEFQPIDKSIQVLSESPTQGRLLVQSLRGLSTKLGPGIYGQAKSMLYAGIDSREIAKDLKMIGDIALSDTAKMDKLTDAFIRTKTQGRLMAEDLTAYRSVGFNPLDIMLQNRTAFGLTSNTRSEDLINRMHNGGISSRDVVKAMEISTSRSGRFYDGAKQGNDNINGNLSEIKNDWNSFWQDAGNEMLKKTHANDFVKKEGDIQKSIINHLRSWFHIGSSKPEIIKEQAADMATKVNSIFQLKEFSSTRADLIRNLQREYGQFFGDVNPETVANKDLWERHKKAYSYYRATMHNTVQQEKIDKNNEYITKNTEKIAALRNQAQYEEAGGINSWKYLNPYYRFQLRASHIQVGTPQEMKDAALFLQRANETKQKENQSLKKSMMQMPGIAQTPEVNQKDIGNFQNVSKNTDKVIFGGSNNITITMDALVKGFTVQVQDAQKGVDSLEDKVTEGLLRALNSAATTVK